MMSIINRKLNVYTVTNPQNTLGAVSDQHGNLRMHEYQQHCQWGEKQSSWKWLGHVLWMDNNRLTHVECQWVTFIDEYIYISCVYKVMDCITGILIKFIYLAKTCFFSKRIWTCSNRVTGTLSDWDLWEKYFFILFQVTWCQRNS